MFGTRHITNRKTETKRELEREGRIERDGYTVRTSAAAGMLIAEATHTVGQVLLEGARSFYRATSTKCAPSVRISHLFNINDTIEFFYRKHFDSGNS